MTQNYYIHFPRNNSIVAINNKISPIRQEQKPPMIQPMVFLSVKSPQVHPTSN